jgi:general secretion pathway protein M
MNMRELSTKTNDRWIKVKEWWNTLATREKQVVAAGGTLLTVFIVYAGIWSPYVGRVSAMRGRIESEQKVLRWMQSADSEISMIEKQSPGTTGKPVSPVVLLSLLQKQIDAAGLGQNLTQLKQSSNASIEIHFQKVGFDKLSGLLIDAAKRYNVSVVQMSAAADNGTPGVVNADLILKSG